MMLARWLRQICWDDWLEIPQRLAGQQPIHVGTRNRTVEHLYFLFFKKRKYLVEHVVATHFWSFNLVLLGVILPIVTALLTRLLKTLNISARYATNDASVSALLQICIGVYL